MNIVLVVSDTFRYKNLSCYGPTPVKTPHLDRFAQGAYVFDNAYLGSFPTIPNRLDIMTGRFSFIDHEWCPLPKDAVTVQQILSASGFVTQLIADNPHLIDRGLNYERGFDGWEWIRGQETDRWRTAPKNVKLPAGSHKLRNPYSEFLNHLRNTAWWRSEEDRFVARTVTTACRWLEENRDQDKFFLHVDLFDPHEPWDAPKQYVDLYDPDYRGEDVSYPRYDFWQGFLTEEELNHTRALYMAEASLVDHWFGVLLERINELDLTGDTAVIFASDHGFLFGEHDLLGKALISPERGFYETTRMYDEIRRIPLMIRLPGQATGQRIHSLVQAPDLMPTILEMAGLVATEMIAGEAKIQKLQCGIFDTKHWQFEPASLHGRSLVPLMRGEGVRLRDIVVCSNTLIHHTPILAKCAIVTEDGWCLHYAGTYGEEGHDAAMLTSRFTDPGLVRAPTGPALFYLPGDPGESTDVADSREGLVREIHERYVHWLEEVGTPPEHLRGRRRLR